MRYYLRSEMYVDHKNYLERVEFSVKPILKVNCHVYNLNYYFFYTKHALKLNNFSVFCLSKKLELQKFFFHLQGFIVCLVNLKKSNVYNQVLSIWFQNSKIGQFEISINVRKLRCQFPFRHVIRGQNGSSIVPS